MKRAGDWKYGAEHVRRHGPAELKALLADWPVDRPRGFNAWVNEPPEDSEIKTIRECIRRSRPIGDVQWTLETAEKLQLGWTLRPKGERVRRREGTSKSYVPFSPFRA